MSHKLLLEWDLAALAGALRIPPRDVALYFRDGRRVSFLLERRIRDAFPGWKLAASEGAGYDLTDERGRHWEVRSVSNRVYFCPSAMVGSRRRFAEDGFLAKLDAIGGYICADITLFPQVPVYVVPVEVIRRLYRAGRLGKSTSISRKQFYSRVMPELDATRLL